MDWLTTVLELPFMQRAFAAGLALGLILPFLGVFVTLRKLSFLGDGIAHAALAGVAVGVLTSTSTFLAALAVAVLFGIALFLLERSTEISNDALIGVLFSGALALGILLMGLKRGYQPELFSFLFGSILSISSQDLWIILVFSAIIFMVLCKLKRHFTLLALDRDSAWLAGMHTEWLDLLFYVLVSVTVVLGVKLLGIVLVSALLVIPPTTAKMLAPSFRILIVGSVMGGELFILLGLTLSYVLDLPSGATIVLVGVSVFVLAAGGRLLASRLASRR